jgi:bifunctional DNA-binding transcriptional regulator/antitoxin component of YhaV-PrlF toxin-antitoxin module
MGEPSGNGRMDMKKGTVLGKTKVTYNHQVTLLQQVTPYLNFNPGDELQFRVNENSEVVIEPVDAEYWKERKRK